MGRKIVERPKSDQQFTEGLTMDREGNFWRLSPETVAEIFKRSCEGLGLKIDELLRGETVKSPMYIGNKNPQVGEWLESMRQKLVPDLVDADTFGKLKQNFISFCNALRIKEN